MPKDLFENIKVVCHSLPNKTLAMQLHWDIDDNGNKNTFVLNTCAEATNTETCNKCQLNLVNLFFEDKNYNIFEPIDPFNL